MKTNSFIFTLALSLSLLTPIRTVLAEEAPKVDFLNLKDGQVVSSPIKIQMGVTGYQVAPAGEIKAGTGHHHIIISGGPISEGSVIPKDEKHLHFGQGQTEAEITLPPGEYSLTLQFADGVHKSYGPNLSKTIKVTVK